MYLLCCTHGLTNYEHAIPSIILSPNSQKVLLFRVRDSQRTSYINSEMSPALVRESGFVNYLLATKDFLQPITTATMCFHSKCIVSSNIITLKSDDF